MPWLNVCERQRSRPTAINFGNPVLLGDRRRDQNGPYCFEVGLLDRATRREHGRTGVSQPNRHAASHATAGTGDERDTDPSGPPCSLHHWLA